jgi:hypothetical protein
MKIVKHNLKILILEGNFKVALVTSLSFFVLTLVSLFVFSAEMWPALVCLSLSIFFLLFTGSKELIIDKAEKKIILNYQRIIYRRYYQFNISQAHNIVAKESASLNFLDKKRYCYYLNIKKGPQIYIGVDKREDFLASLFLDSNLYQKKLPETVDLVKKYLGLKIKIEENLFEFKI